jgi:hypothetical protein
MPSLVRRGLIGGFLGRLGIVQCASFAALDRQGENHDSFQAISAEKWSSNGTARVGGMDFCTCGSHEAGVRTRLVLESSRHQNLSNDRLAARWADPVWAKRFQIQSRHRLRDST